MLTITADSSAWSLILGRLRKELGGGSLRLGLGLSWCWAVVWHRGPFSCLWCCSVPPAISLPQRAKDVFIIKIEKTLRCLQVPTLLSLIYPLMMHWKLYHLIQTTLEHGYYFPHFANDKAEDLTGKPFHS